MASGTVNGRECALAPVVLFAFKRPNHLRRTIESLQRNALATDSDVIVFSDAAPTAADEPAVKDVRQYLKSIRGFKSFAVIEREENYGLAESVIHGLNSVFVSFDRVIVLEDDLDLSPVFLKYMNDALWKYENSDAVMHVAAYMYPIDPTGLPQTFFFRQASCWGWGTWKRSWQVFQSDTDALMQKFDRSLRYRFNVDGTGNFWDQLRLQQQGRINSWAIRWYASTFLSGGLCVHPSVSLVQNLGTDGSGTHSGTTTAFNVAVGGEVVQQFDDRIVEHPVALERIKAFLRCSRPPFPQRILRKLRYRWVS